MQSRRYGSKAPREHFLEFRRTGICGSDPFEKHLAGSVRVMVSLSLYPAADQVCRDDRAFGHQHGL